ncbi:amino acid/polyamine/organocation transporter, APC superfamily [Flavobacterium glycines]|uniref:Amino acid permease n=1 Tax=Flavobacterium glycines TaxID=551990 RepID=A0A1B9DY56_9FLAO|nr:APC family permease [Flavobacterium glycines]OCB74621.1 amino acid permease [Flavobacterium glycines]GEL09401.1 amino acid transporter [Flavobacterium glycines]SDJ08118.1 amino acid/polyamine/organocation transporter, APC superfamily [Flavobacterium glycines]
MINQEEEFKRTIGVFGLSANIMNVIIGAGIFALPAIVASSMGASSIIAYFFCGLLMALIMLCFAEASSKVTQTGGVYSYIETAFGPYAGFLAGVFTVGGTLLADAAVSNALVNVLGSAHPVFELAAIRILFLILVFGGLAFINVIGVKQGIGLVKINTIAKLIPLLLLVVFGWQAVSVQNLVIERFPDIQQLGKTSLVLFFAFQGCESGIVVSGEVINPKRTIPKAIFISITAIVILYMLIQTVAQGVLGNQLPQHTATPLAATADVIFGPIGFVILTTGAAISMFGFLSGDILNNPRTLYALSRDRVIPIKALAKIHSSFATPYIAIIVYALLGFLIAATGSFESLVVIASSSILIVYMGVVLAVIKLRYSQKAKADEFTIPGGLSIPILSIAIILYFLSNLTQNEIIGTVISIGVLSVIYALIYFTKLKK